MVQRIYAQWVQILCETVLNLTGAFHRLPLVPIPRGRKAALISAILTKAALSILHDSSGTIHRTPPADFSLTTMSSI
jgi:hypothetical protein